MTEVDSQSHEMSLGLNPGISAVSHWHSVGCMQFFKCCMCLEWKKCQNIAFVGTWLSSPSERQKREWSNDN